MKPLNPDPWDPRTIRRLHLQLSERTPIQCSVSRHARARSGFFDMHYGLELGIVLSGRMRRFHRDRQYQVGPGQVWMCGMWEPHGFDIAKPVCEVVVFVIWPPTLAALKFPEAPALSWIGPFTVPSRDRPQTAPTDRKALITLGRKVVRLMPADTEIKHLQLRLLLLEILLVLASKWTRPTRLADLGADAYARINRALNLVFENRRMITGQEAARACGMGRNTFTHVFKSLMGIHFPDFALRYRLNAAAGELLATDEPVKAVARNWGFTDSSHLHRCFQTHYGCSPGQYRKRKNFG